MGKGDSIRDFGLCGKVGKDEGVYQDFGSLELGEVLGRKRMRGLEIGE